MLTNPPTPTRDATIRSDTGLAAALRISLTRLNRRLRKQTAGHSLSSTQLATLATIDRNDGMSPRELAEHEKVQPPSMTRVITALEERGLILRTPHGSDRRQVLLSATPEGKALLKEERRRKEAWLTQRLKELTPEERATLRQAAPILEKLSKA
ncbi:MarR family winged helix-turn-helix transcriptional regulator [Bailinhaonella thermotolerans]|uniref:MarR family transcriptional regulator n=1 Tax=Bailinhaonella thermotolerans TaxID=1070861 RepID=A0A3A4AT09_9ACTN|nr:MarR family transcriptional regulator [Bailinhaonella thermotolerans]RJL33170.1 MarR family transcriptional regulator [Bailinhaonella thermotolerans]